MENIMDRFRNPSLAVNLTSTKTAEGSAGDPPVGVAANLANW